MLKILLQHVFSKGALKGTDRVVVWAAALGTRRKKGIFEKAVKSYLSNEMQAEVPYRLVFHPSATHPMLQVADYCCWAIARKWKDGDERSYRLVADVIRSEFDVFRIGRTEYY